MSNLNKDQPSIRVHAPPGGRSANIFGVPEPEQPISTKKHHMQSDIFGCKSNNEPAATKPTRPVKNNIFGNEPEQPAQKSKVYSEKNRSTIFDEAPPQQPSSKPDRQRSNIFGTNEPVVNGPTRPVAEKFKSNIFGGADDEQNKRQPGSRQGLRDPNASRMGYNPINGEPYATKDNVQSKMESLDISDTKSESEPVEETKDEPEQQQQSPVQEVAAEKPTNNVQEPVTNGKNGHTSVRVHHPPGGRSNGPLW